MKVKIETQKIYTFEFYAIILIPLSPLHEAAGIDTSSSTRRHEFDSA